MLDTVVPVGRALGTLDEGASFTIRVGARLVATTRADYSYWLAVCAGAAGDTAGFTPVIPASLRRAGLVLRLTETDAPAVLSRHHLLAQGHGLGYDSRTDTFVIGLRLWKTTGRGWWHDYEVGGDWKLENGELTMKPSGKVQDLGHSKGAALADPLLALAEGVIQKAIGGALNTAVPTSSGEMGDMGAEIVIDRLQAVDGQLRLMGSAVVHGPKITPYGKLKK